MGLEVNRFVNSGEINEDLICNICKGVLEEAVWAPTCEHAFCKVCINQWLLRRSVCPNDRQPLSASILKPIPRFMRNLLEKLQIKCDFASNGCQQVFHLESIRSHTNVCDFNPEKRVECLSGCGLIIRKADLPNHSCIKCLRKVISDNNRRHETSISALNTEITSLRNETQKIKNIFNGLQNDVKRLLADKQMTVISSVNSQVSSIPTIHKSSDRSVGRLSVPNPFVLITPLTSISSTYSSSGYDEPSSSTLSSATTSRLSNEEPAFKRRTTTIRVATPTSMRDPRLLGHESDHFYQNPIETTIYSRSPSPNQSSHQYMRSAINLSISNDSNSEDESTAMTVSESFQERDNHSNSYITLEDHEFDGNDDTEEEDPSFGIIEDYEVEIQTPD